MMRNQTQPRVSIVTPLYNEEEVIGELLARTIDVLDNLPGGPHEFVLVDDGSSDRTLSVATAVAEVEDRIVVVALSRNFGHQAALTAGLETASGDVIVLMDGDLQDRPEVIPDFLERWQSGADIVYAVRESRQESWYLRACYSVFYRIIRAMSDVELPPDSGDFCLLSRNAANAMINSRESHRYLRGLRAWVGFRQEPLSVARDARFAGEPKYTMKRLFQLAFDGIFSFSIAPLRLVTWAGMFVVAATAMLMAFWIGAWMMGRSPEGFTALATSIAFFSGVQLLFLGLIGEYVGRIYQQVKGRPNFLIDQVYSQSLDRAQSAAQNDQRDAQADSSKNEAAAG